MQTKSSWLSKRRWVTVPILLFLIVTVFSPLTAIEAQDTPQQTHVVQQGENLFRIALRYGLTVDQLAAANSIADPTQIYAGQVLMIPGTTAPAGPVVDTSSPPAAEPASAAPAAAPIYHIVQQGETLASIGRQYGISWPDLAAWNGLTDANQIYAGQRLVVNDAAAPDSAAVAGPTIVETTPPAESSAPPSAVPPSGQRTYTVQSGDRLASIARQHGISWTTIARANNILDPNTIYVGQVLVIPYTDDAAGTDLEPTGGVPSAPAPTIATGKQIVVDTGAQMIYAYENGQLLRAVSVSTGLWGTPTVLGDYRVYWKLTSQTMSGPGYYLPGVPWVMYFYQGYAIHGTYWHNNFGQPMSHGCVNLPTDEAEWFFRWAEVGTPVHVQS